MRLTERKRTAEDEVHRSPVVGIDEREVPELGALVDVGHARRRQLDELLGQRRDPPRFDKWADELLHRRGLFCVAAETGFYLRPP